MMYDFIDIGSSGKGGSMRFATAKFGSKGYGIDIDPAKVEQSQKAGLDVRLQDIFSIEDKATWVTIIHTLEHLPDRKYCERLIQKACEIGEYVYISYPNFDDDVMLMTEYDCRFFWSDWTGHTLHLTSYELYKIVNRLNKPFKLYKDIIIPSTTDKNIVPLDAPIDGFEYRPDMGKKQNHKLKDVYKEIRCIIGRNDMEL